jgi:hypothetical protein
MRVRIRAGDVECEAELNDSTTARAIARALPIDGRAKTWGEEIYFEIPVAADEASDARQDMEVGELAYWPPGSAFCIFFGRTPASTGEGPRAASNVNPVGRVVGDARSFSSVENGASVRIERG